MFSTEDQQIGICLLKSNLEEIGNELVLQRSAIPNLEAENNKKSNEASAVLRVVRSLNAEIEKLKLESVCLTAKRAQLKRQSDELSETLEAARENRDQLANVLKHEDSEMEAQIRRYEDSLQEKADRFRKTLGYYDEAEIKNKMKNINLVIDELEKEVGQKQSFVDALKKRAENIRPDVTENILEICGKPELDDKVKALTSELEALQLSKKRKTGSLFFYKL